MTEEHRADGAGRLCPYCGYPRADHQYVSPTSCVLVSSVGTPIQRDLGASIVDDHAHDLKRLADWEADRG